MSVACFVQMDEFSSFVKAISPYLDMPITFIVYIPLKAKRSSYFISESGVKRKFVRTLYPVNLLRDLAIESIYTTHYMNIDADIFISGSNGSLLSSSDTIEQSIQSNLKVLQKEENVLLIITFQPTANMTSSRCLLKGDGCNEMYFLSRLLT